MPEDSQPLPPSIFSRFHFAGISIGTSQPTGGRERNSSITHVVAGEAVVKNCWECLPGGYTSGSHLWLIAVSYEHVDARKHATQQLLPVVVAGPGRPSPTAIKQAIQNHPDAKIKDRRIEFTGRGIQVGVVIQPMGLARFPQRMRAVVNIAIGLKLTNQSQQVAAYARLNDVRIAVSMKYM
jgi:hypothetical protein